MTPSKQLDNDLQNRVGILGDGVSKERIERAAEVITNTGIVIRGGGALHVAEKILTTDDSAALQIAEKLAVALRGSEQLLQDAQDIMRSNLVPNGISNKDAIAAYIALLDNTRQRAVQTATHKALAAWNTRTTPTSSAGLHITRIPADEPLFSIEGIVIAHQNAKPADQIEAVAEALAGTIYFGSTGNRIELSKSEAEEIALIAIKASGAEHVRELVEAVK